MRIKIRRKKSPGDQAVEQVAEVMIKAGVAPEKIHAFRRTRGLLPTDQNMHLIKPEDLAEWNAAIEEYRAMQGRVKP